MPEYAFSFFALDSKGQAVPAEIRVEAESYDEAVILAYQELSGDYS